MTNTNAPALGSSFLLWTEVPADAQLTPSTPVRVTVTDVVRRHRLTGPHIVVTDVRVSTFGEARTYALTMTPGADGLHVAPHGTETWRPFVAAPLDSDAARDALVRLHADTCCVRHGCRVGVGTCPVVAREESMTHVSCPVGDHTGQACTVLHGLDGHTR